MAASCRGPIFRPPTPGAGWPAARRVVVKAVVYGLLPLAEALERYGLSEEEFALWRDAVDRHGDQGLKVTAIQKLRQL